MKTIVSLCALAMTMAVPALAQQAESAAAPAFEVVETNEQGRVTKVRLEGRVYDVCLADNQDSCINPRDAGLDFGNRELRYWPGRPASEIEEPLPYDPPAPAPVVEPPVEAKPAPGV